MSNALVSVVIPVYNRENTIKRAVDSVLNQTYTDIEVIVVDDGSSDNTVNIVRQYTDNRIRLICQKHGGANKARNIGIEQSSGAYIAFQDSDDEWLPEKLEMQIKLVEEQGYLACYCPYNLYENDAVCVVPFDYSNLEKYQIDLNRTLARHNVVSTQTLIIKREVLNMLKKEYFDEQMFRWQDYEFVIRIAQNVKIGYINKPLVNVFRSIVSISSNKKALYAAVALLIRKHADFLEIRQFLENFIEAYDVIADTGENVINGLNMIKAALEDAGLGNSVDIKDMLITYIAQRSASHRAIEEKECAYRIGTLRNLEFIIYGAGKVGQEVYQRLKAKGLYPKCFIVTTCEKKEYIDGIPVIPIDENNDRQDTVIVAISREHQAELKENLIDQGYQSFFSYHGTV
ncbi:MAG: glycosyltransferase family 2 protein [Lachnospiraceae bacterium]|nr:glycosyltransferase family 2 protein [Lachnospiraceae bacterium]